MFLTPLDLEADLQPDYWYLLDPLVWSDQKFGKITVPAGFRTDLASDRIIGAIPCMSPTGRSRMPAVAHDWAYRALRVKGKPWCDSLLRAALRSVGCSAVTAWMFYTGVRVFGEPFWDEDARPLDADDFATPADYQAWRASCSDALSGRKAAAS